MQKNLLNLLSFAAGAILPIAFAPWAYWPLAIISPCILLFVIEKQSLLLKQQNEENQNTQHVKQELKTLFFSSLLYWFGFYLVGVSWVYVSIHKYGDTPAVLAALMSFAFCAGLALVNTLQVFIYRLLKLQPFSLFSFPASIVLVEWFRSWFLSGFPWLFFGYALLDSPLESFASVGGVYFLSFIVLLLASCLYHIAKFIFYPTEQKSKPVFVLAVTIPILIAFGGYFLGKQQWIQIDKHNSLRVHLVQGNIPQKDKWLPENQQKILNIYVDLIGKSFAKIDSENSHNPELKHVIILPEAAMPTFQSELQQVFDSIDIEAKKRNTAVISGIFYDEFHKDSNDFDVYNSIIAVGDGSGLYHKQKLVPFGEYVPLENFIRGELPFFDLPYSSFSRGWPEQKGLQVFNYHIAPFICYEVLYPSLAYTQGRHADFLLTISNDAWFGNSLGPKQHFEMARMRALELGKYLIRTTNTGITAIINPQGEVVSMLEKDKRLILEGDVYTTSGSTPFSHWGNSPILYFSLFIVVLCAILAYLKQFHASRH